MAIPLNSNNAQSVDTATRVIGLELLWCKGQPRERTGLFTSHKQPSPPLGYWLPNPALLGNRVENRGRCCFLVQANSLSRSSGTSTPDTSSRMRCMTCQQTSKPNTTWTPCGQVIPNRRKRGSCYFFLVAPKQVNQPLSVIYDSGGSSQWYCFSLLLPRHWTSHQMQVPPLSGKREADVRSFGK